jgi:hypothetical protein
MYLPSDVQEIIWEFYWKDIFKNQVINEFNYLINLDIQLFKFKNENRFLEIDYTKKDQYLNINQLIKFCLKSNSFRILTKLQFFKNNYLIEYNKTLSDDHKFVLSFMLFYSNYMAMKVYYDFIRVIVEK